MGQCDGKWSISLVSVSKPLITKITAKSNWHYFSEECDRLKLVFSQLKYRDNLVNSTISRFVAARASDQPVSWPAVIRVVLLFKDQPSADIVRAQLEDLSHKIQTTVQPVFVSQKIERDLKFREAKPPIVKQQCLVYKFQCDLCDAGCAVSHAVINTNVLKNSKILLRQLASIFATNILWLLRILQRTLVS